MTNTNFLIFLVFTHTTQIQAPKILQLEETSHKRLALDMFNEFGVDTSIQDQVYYLTSNHRFNGEAVCKNVLRRMRPSNNPPLVLERATVAQLNLDSSLYLKGEEKLDDCHVVYGVKCKYGKQATDYYFVCNAWQKFYYIFGPFGKVEGNTTKYYTEIKAVLKIVVKDSDFSELNIEVTKYPEIADRIFGKFGATTRKSNMFHVCNKRNDGVTLIGQEKCNKILNYLKRPFTYLYVKCEKQIISRMLTKKYEPSKIGKPILGKKYEVVICAYSKKDAVHNSILITNTSTLGFYYVGEQIYGQHWTITSVVQVD